MYSNLCDGFTFGPRPTTAKSAKPVPEKNSGTPEPEPAPVEEPVDAAAPEEPKVARRGRRSARK